MTDIPPTLSVAVLGAGIIGAAIARNLARKGFSVRVWNRSSEKTKSLADDGIATFEDVADAVTGADIMVTVLKDGPAVLETVSKALPGISQGAIWLQLSTVGVDGIESLANLADEHGLTIYDAPVQGTRLPAEQGKLVILASGPSSRREVAQSVFDAIGQKTLWVSDAVGASSRLKLALNAYVFALTHGTAETLSIARALGVEPALVLEVVTGSPLDSGYFQGKAAAMLGGDFVTSFSVENGLKDAQLVVEALEGTTTQADLAEAGLARFRRLVRTGLGDMDIAASFLA